MVRFKPYCAAIQTRFKWRHKPSDKWRRLMDATCFAVDWITKPTAASFGQSASHWSHIITPAHVLCPWDYPNFYPPVGPTRFVSQITLADTLTQLRTVSLQGDAVHKQFLSKYHTYTCTNPRLDLAVAHAEQFLRRSGETKLLRLQNEGHMIRPQLEIVRKLTKGDIVWIYGMTAHDELFDEEKGAEPKMVPTGVRGVVHAITAEHFWIDTLGVDIEMGMCGSPVFRGGKCVGMVTAKVHPLSDCKELAGCAMCTSSHDIFNFLLEVEEQLKVSSKNEPETRAAVLQRSVPQSSVLCEQRDWRLHASRLARRIEVPISIWADQNDQFWNTDEDGQANAMFGPNGYFNDENLESVGYHMNTERDASRRPHDVVTPKEDHRESTTSGNRRDMSPDFTVHGAEEPIKNSSEWSRNVTDDLRDVMNKSFSDGNIDQISSLKSAIDSVHNERVAKDNAASVFSVNDPANFVAGAASSGSIRRDGSHTENNDTLWKDFGEGVKRYQNVNQMVRKNKEATSGADNSGVEDFQFSASQNAKKGFVRSPDQLERKLKRQQERADSEKKYQEKLHARLATRKDVLREHSGDDLTTGLW